MFRPECTLMSINDETRQAGPAPLDHVDLDCHLLNCKHNLLGLTAGQAKA